MNYYSFSKMKHDAYPAYELSSGAVGYQVDCRSDVDGFDLKPIKRNQGGILVQKIPVMLSTQCFTKEQAYKKGMLQFFEVLKHTANEAKTLFPNDTLFIFRIPPHPFELSGSLLFYFRLYMAVMPLKAIIHYPLSVEPYFDMKWLKELEP